MAAPLREARNRLGLALFAARVLAACLLSRVRPVALALFVSRRKRAFARDAAPGAAALLHARMWKTRRGESAAPRLAAGRALRAALRLARRDRLTLLVWGYAETEIGLAPAALGPATLRLESGLYGLGDGPVAGYVVDRGACYFDGRAPTDLERRLEAYPSGDWRRDPAERAFVEGLAASAFQKYARIDQPLDLDLTEEDLVVVGQVAGDAAWASTETAVADNRALVLRAAADHPEARRVFLKPHPFDPSRDADAAWLASALPEAAVIPPMIRFADVARRRPRVAVVSSGAGLEAALRGCPVSTYGLGFYAGWGFTRDAVTTPRRSNRLTPEDVAFVAYWRHTRYVDTRTGRRIAPAEALGGAG